MTGNHCPVQCKGLRMRCSCSLLPHHRARSHSRVPRCRQAHSHTLLRTQMGSVPVPELDQSPVPVPEPAWSLGLEQVPELAGTLEPEQELAARSHTQRPPRSVHWTT
jgi:hypothetical protein